jgi:glycolate oxidase FAD binding subunit
LPLIDPPSRMKISGPAQTLFGGVESVHEQITATVRKAGESGAPLNIVGGGTKAFYGRRAAGAPLATSAYRGIVEYEASELVITVRAGTTLQLVEQTLAEENQCFSFEPPSFGSGCTVGGVVAAGLSGPRRPYAGAVRDAVLGVTVLSSSAEPLRFGGQVMKNVAGYDVSRLMAGAMGTLGLLLAVSLRVAPRPERECTLLWELPEARAHERMRAIARRPWPVSAMSFDGRFLRARLSGHAETVRDAEIKLDPEAIATTDYWRELNNQTLSFFQSSEPLWRLSVAPAAELPPLAGDWLWDWGGACRWVKSREPAARIREAARLGGGHATLFRGDAGDAPFAPLDRVSLKIHRRLKKTFDPEGIFNPGRLYAEL